jgi:hypothetical protein
MSPQAAWHGAAVSDSATIKTSIANFAVFFMLPPRGLIESIKLERSELNSGSLLLKSKTGGKRRQKK